MVRWARAADYEWGGLRLEFALILITLSIAYSKPKSKPKKKSKETKPTQSSNQTQSRRSPSHTHHIINIRTLIRNRSRSRTRKRSRRGKTSYTSRARFTHIRIKFSERGIRRLHTECSISRLERGEEKWGCCESESYPCTPPSGISELNQESRVDINLLCRAVQVNFFSCLDSISLKIPILCFNSF